MSKRSLIFAASTSTCTYSLLALPSPILALLRSNHSDPSTAPNLEIRGHGTDAAVLVTKDQTFSIRGVQNSNSLLLCDTEGKLENGRREEDAFMLNDDAISSGRPRKKRKLDEIVIETTLHETLELAGSIPRFDKLYNVLSRIEYDGEDGEIKPEQITLASLSSLLPASDDQIIAALRLNRVAVLRDGYLRSISLKYRLILLSALVKSFPSPLTSKRKGEEEKKLIIASVKLDDMLETLDAMDCNEEIGQRMIEWYGEESDSKSGVYHMSIENLVREIGICVLAQGGHTEQPLTPFLENWRKHCHAFASLCVMPLISEASLQPTSSTIRYFPPALLSPVPSIRFTELFAVKPRWTEIEMTPFINDLVGGDKKKREAMALKFVRKVVEKGKPVVWTARNTW